MRPSDLPAYVGLDPAIWAAGGFDSDPILVGGSGVIGPDGEWVAGPVTGSETIVYAEIDLTRIVEEQQSLDTTGHYNRPDVFQLTVDERPQRQINWLRDPPTESIEA